MMVQKKFGISMTGADLFMGTDSNIYLKTDKGKIYRLDEVIGAEMEGDE